MKNGKWLLRERADGMEYGWGKDDTFSKKIRNILRERPFWIGLAAFPTWMGVG